jgi:hypothetical protein
MEQRYALYVTFACMQAFKNRILPFAWLGFGLLYLFLPGINPTGDALGYAGEYLQNADTGRWLFSPHHLLYGPFGQISYRLFGKYFTPYLPWMQVMNALAAGLSLFILKRCFETLTQNKAASNVAVLIAGSAFATMRFATENETYIIPLLLSLGGTWALLKYHSNEKPYRLYVGFGLLGIAVLFHQIHCWWWFAAAIFHPSGRKKQGAVLLTLGLIVIAYLAAARYQETVWWAYPFSDAMNGTVSLIPGLDNLTFTIINSIRTWVQVHGNIPYFLNEWPWLWLFPLMALGFMVVAIFTKKPQTNNEKLQNPPQSLRWLRFALLFQFLWAAYSVGNAEFMVMIPFLLLLSFTGLFLKLQYKLLPASLAILCWNLGIFLIPNANIKTINYGAELNLLLKIANEQKADGMVFVARERVMLENYLSIQSADYQKQFRDAGIQLMDADSLGTEQKLPVYTDIFDYPMPMSRSSIIYSNPYKKFEKITIIGTESTLFGPLQLYKIE